MAELQAVMRALENLERAEELRRQAKEELTMRAVQLVLADRASLSTLYWGFPEVPVRPMAQAIGMSEVDFRALVDPIEVTACSVCGGPVKAASRHRRKQILAARHPASCDDCRFQWQAEVRHAWDRQRAAERARIAELRSMPYSEYLKTGHWQEVRQVALKRARYRCQMCNADAHLDVHHRTYERRGDEEAADVIAVCRACHERHHVALRPASLAVR